MSETTDFINDLTASETTCTELLSELVAIPSPSSQELEVQQYIYGWFEERNIPVKYQKVKDGLINVVATIENGSTNDQTILMCGHSDTVPPVDGWETDPFTPTVINNRLYGVGSMDMKAGLATAMLTMEALNKCQHLWKGRIIFVSFADEEAFSRGAKGLIDSGLKADMALMCEPEFDYPLLGNVGKVQIRVKVKGKTAHGSFPERGINAVIEAAKFLVELDKMELKSHALVGTGSQCVLGIDGGPKEYVVQVPEHCEFTINKHIVPGESDQSVIQELEDIKESINSNAVFSFEIEEPYYPPYYIDEKHDFVKSFKVAYKKVFNREPNFDYGSAVSDANYLSEYARIPTIAFGPGGKNLHAANEWAAIEEMPKAMEVYLSLIFNHLKY